MRRKELRSFFIVGVILLWGLPMVDRLRAQGEVSFIARRDFAAGIGPSAVTAADFNNDGRLDLAVANYYSGNVSILLGQGDGTFRAALNFGAGSNPWSITAADFNNDGLLDLAVANSNWGGGSGSVSILLGQGDGSFGAALNFPTGNRSRSVTAADFNDDGLLDLAVANSGDVRTTGNVSILLGNGDGTFRAAQNFGPGLSPWSVAVADFNNDGHMDLAVAYAFSNNVSILLGNGDGTFRTAQDFATADSPRSVTVADFNDDGLPDLAVANYHSDSVSILQGNGDGTFRAALNFGARIAPVSVTVADFNDDGLPDLAVANANSKSVSILINDSAQLRQLW